MTLFAATTDRRVVTMSADSGCSHSDGLISRTGEPKIWQAGEMLIGASGTVRACQVAQHKLVVPALLDDLHAYFVTAFWDALAPLIAKDDHLELLIGVRGQLFHIHPGGSVTSDPTIPYAAIGCAAQVALGALFAGAPLELAMQAADRHCLDIRGPFITFTSPQTLASAP